MKLGSRVSRVSEPSGGDLVRLSRGLSISTPGGLCLISSKGSMGYFMFAPLSPEITSAWTEEHVVLPAVTGAKALP